jgi:ABC-2 type transport system ATP-binding protein
LRELPTVKRTLVLRESPAVVVRAYPQAGARNGDLQASIFELALRERWKLIELKTEEGRLDEVFRSITLPDTTRTVKEEAHV